MQKTGRGATAKTERCLLCAMYQAVSEPRLDGAKAPRILNHPYLLGHTLLRLMSYEKKRRDK